MKLVQTASPEDGPEEFLQQISDPELRETAKNQGYLVGNPKIREIVTEFEEIDRECELREIGHEKLYHERELLKETKGKVDQLSGLHQYLARSLGDIELTARVNSGSLSALIKNFFTRKEEQRISAYDIVDQQYEIGKNMNENFKQMVESNRTAVWNLITYKVRLSAKMEGIHDKSKDLETQADKEKNIAEQLERQAQQLGEKGKANYRMQDVADQGGRRALWHELRGIALERRLTTLIDLHPEVEFQIRRALQATDNAISVYDATEDALEYFHAMAPVNLNIIRDGKMTGELSRALHMVRISSQLLEKRTQEGYYALANFRYDPRIKRRSKRSAQQEPQGKDIWRL
ncbi:MAG: hypothetical protein AABX86_01595 [Nanoarchaeota archaeon]